MESTQEKLSRVRKPRVHIIYEVETEGATVQKELPFVVGVLGDFAADNAEAQKSLKDRRFVQIDRDNFDAVMARINPKLNVKVANTILNDNSELALQLNFQAIEDFEPEQIVDQVEPLKNLLDARNKLRDLLIKVDRSTDLEDVLEEVLQNTDALKTFSNDINAAQPAAPAETAAKAAAAEVASEAAPADANAASGTPNATTPETNVPGTPDTAPKSPTV